MRKLLMAGLAAAGMTLGIATAQAATIGTTPASNDVLGIKEGWFGANLFLFAGAGGADLKLEFLGKEAGFTNTFNFGGGAVEYNTNDFPNSVQPVNPALPAIGPTYNFAGVASGLLDFVFSVLNSGQSIANGANMMPGAAPPPNAPNFFVTFGQTGDSTVNGSSPTSGTVVILSLDDDGAPDDNHDDLVVRLSITGGTIIGCRFGQECVPPNEIPEPSTYALLLAGLLGLGFIARRRMN